MRLNYFLFVNLLFSSVWAVAGASEPGTPVRIVVTAEATGKHSPPTLSARDVSVTSGKDNLPVIDLVPASGANARLQLFLLMDDSSTTEIGTQIGDLKQFVQALPATAEIAIGYMRNGTTNRVQEFTTDHATAAAKIRLPLGAPGANASPWFSVADLIKHWPETEARREILVVSDGIDRYYEGGADNPYVNAAIEQAQRKGVVVNSIYWTGAGHYGHSYWRINWGQSYLSQIADQTGGEQYYQGFGNPVSFQPFLSNLAARLENQYLLTFRAKPQNKAGWLRIRAHTEVANVEVVAPSQVWVPAS